MAELGLEPRRLALVDHHTVILPLRFIIEKSKDKLALTMLSGLGIVS